jgi:lysophospholipase L1-like esterase
VGRDFINLNIEFYYAIIHYFKTYIRTNMKTYNYLLALLLLVSLQMQTAFSQSSIKWWNPANSKYSVIEGQAWPDRIKSRYDRLPKEAEKTVRKEVWDLSENSAGLVIRFRTNSDRIIVHYAVKEAFAMPHLPATGRSGVDLYAKNSDGEWLWCGAKYSFEDTVKYDYLNIDPSDRYHNSGREYRLYLPLYNTVKWLEIGTRQGSLFEALPVRLEKPIVVYGTSIAQGGCASRPGMAWSSILERKLDRPVINLGFSGNGRLEKEVIDLIAEIDAKIYVLDCLPNLGPNEELKQLIVKSVKRLKEKHPSVPVLLVDHAGYGGEKTVKENNTRVSGLNEINRQAFAMMKEEGIGQIYLLPREEIGLDFDSFVDGVHPTDLGMQQYALAYEKCIRKILKEPIGSASTTRPVTQYREPDKYDWEKRHEELLRLNQKNSPKICLIGNSIIHYWGGVTKGSVVQNSDVWNHDMEPFGARNFGFGWDRIENVLWRIYHDELEGYSPKQVVIMIGTNNLGINTNQEILDGLELLIQAVKARQPQASILIMGLLPRRDLEKRIADLNLMIARLASLTEIEYDDAGQCLLNIEGKIDESLFSDGLHPNETGYRNLTTLIKKHLK